MAIYDLVLSRNNGPTMANYIGHAGRLFYESASGGLRISDGTTVGGLPMPLTVATTSIVGGIKPAAGFTVSPDGTLALNAGNMFELTEANVFVLKVATDTQVGGVKLGPGVTTNSEGQIIIDPEGLTFSFGDFTSTVGTYAVGHPKAGDDYALLGSVNAEEDVIIASNGSTGVVKVIGDFSVRHTNGNLDDVLAEEPIFRITADGQIRMLVPAADPLLGALEIVGNDSGVAHPPNQTGVIVHVTGNNGLVSRNYFDAANNYALLVGRRYNGTAADTTKVLSGELMLRIAGQASNDTGFETFGPAQIDLVATEDQGPNNQGGEIRIRATPNGSSASAGITQVASFNATTGVTSTIGFVGNVTGDLTGDVTGDVSGNAGTVTNGVYTTGTQSIGGAKTFTTQVTAPRLVETGIRTVNGGTGCTIDFSSDSLILWDTPSGTATVTLSNYTAGATVKVIIRVGATSRDLSYGVATVNNSTTGSTTYNGSGAGSASIANQCVILTYICVDTTSTNCYVSVAIEPLVP